MKWKYSDIVENQRIMIWGLLVVCSILIIAQIYQTYTLNQLDTQIKHQLNETQFVAIPHAGHEGIIQPGVLPFTYIENMFLQSVNKVASFTEESIEDNYNYLFSYIFSPELTMLVKKSLVRENWFFHVKNEKMIGFFDYDKAKSESGWCKNISYFNSVKGVACGIISGKQTILSLGAEKVTVRQKKEVSYILYGIQKSSDARPESRNPYVIQILRMRKGDLSDLKKELEQSKKTGVLPPLEMGG